MFQHSTYHCFERDDELRRRSIKRRHDVHVVKVVGVLLLRRAKEAHADEIVLGRDDFRRDERCSALQHNVKRDLAVARRLEHRLATVDQENERVAFGYVLRAST